MDDRTTTKPQPKPKATSNHPAAHRPTRKRTRAAQAGRAAAKKSRGDQAQTESETPSQKCTWPYCQQAGTEPVLWWRIRLELCEDKRTEARNYDGRLCPTHWCRVRDLVARDDQENQKQRFRRCLYNRGCSERAWYNQEQALFATHCLRHNDEVVAALGQPGTFYPRPPQLVESEDAQLERWDRMGPVEHGPEPKPPGWDDEDPCHQRDRGETKVKQETAATHASPSGRPATPARHKTTDSQTRPCPYYLGPRQKSKPYSNQWTL